MKVQTYLFGEVEVDPAKVITFPQGLMAFESSKRFMLAHESGQGEPASYTLQSLDDPGVAVQIVDPVAIGFQYELVLDAAEAALLQNPDPADIAVMLMVFKREPEEAVAGLSANVRAPLIINTKARLGLQKAISKPRSNVVISNLVSAV